MPAQQRCSHCRTNGHNIRTCSDFRSDLSGITENINLTRRAVARLRDLFQRKDDQIYDLNVEVMDLQEQVQQQEQEIAQLKSEVAAAMVVIDTQDTLIEAYAREVESLQAQLADAKAFLSALRA